MVSSSVEMLPIQANSSGMLAIHVSKLYSFSHFLVFTYAAISLSYRFLSCVAIRSYFCPRQGKKGEGLHHSLNSSPVSHTTCLLSRSMSAPEKTKTEREGRTYPLGKTHLALIIHCSPPGAENLGLLGEGDASVHVWADIVAEEHVRRERPLRLVGVRALGLLHISYIGKF